MGLLKKGERQRMRLLLDDKSDVLICCIVVNDNS